MPVAGVDARSAGAADRRVRRGVMVAGAGTDLNLLLERVGAILVDTRIWASTERRVGSMSCRIVVPRINVDDLRFRPAGGYKENDGDHESEDA